MEKIARNMLIGGLILGLFAAGGTALVAVTQLATAERIAENQRQALLDSLNALLPPGSYDNAISEDTLQLHVPELRADGAPLTVYRARKAGQPVAAILTTVAPDGYSGDIQLLVGINSDGTLAGVRVVAHKETPGLGDAIEAERNAWILGFAGRSLLDPVEGKWGVKRDGGVFDQFTGATITPRAVVAAVKRTLLYFRDQRDALFVPAAQEAKHE